MRNPDDLSPLLHLSFPHDWKAAVLSQRPPILPARHYVYPRIVEEVERGALEVLVKPATPGTPVGFLATFALGFADPAVPTGVWSCPDPDWLCAVAGGYAYMVDTADPGRWEQVEYRPVLAVTALLPQRLLLFSGHQSLMAYGVNGKAWETGRLSWEGFRILEVHGASLTGVGWDLITDREYQFEVDLETGAQQRLS